MFLNHLPSSQAARGPCFRLHLSASFRQARNAHLLRHDIPLLGARNVVEKASVMHKKSWTAALREEAGSSLDTAAPKLWNQDASALGSVMVVGIAAAEFGFLALDLKTTHLFAGIDSFVHEAVLVTTDSKTREDAASILSNLFPLLGFSILIASTVLALLRSSEQGLKRCVTVAWGAQLSSFIAVGVTKELFARPRPSNMMHSFAFPSGHTCGANVLMGVSLFLLLDRMWTICGYNGTTQRNEEVEIEGDDVGNQYWAKAPLSQQQRVMIWIAATAITAAGRIEGDRHWLSDTMGGATLGVVFVASSFLVLRYLEDSQQHSS